MTSKSSIILKEYLMQALVHCNPLLLCEDCDSEEMKQAVMELYDHDTTDKVEVAENKVLEAILGLIDASQEQYEELMARCASGQ